MKHWMDVAYPNGPITNDWPQAVMVALEANVDHPHLESVKTVFAATADKIVFDKELVEQLHRYKQNFINRNKDHAAFFGGNLLGVYPVRFTTTDVNNWFDNIIQADEKVLEEKLHALETINPEWFISSNVMNLSCIYLAHQLFHSDLPAALKRQAMFDVFLILQFKFITSIQGQFFRFLADKQVAEATYAALNMKFILKEKGSWLKLLHHRCDEILARTSPHYRALSTMDSDKQIVDMLNAIHGALKGYIKNIREVMERVRLTGGKVSSVSNVMSVNGEEILKDRTKGPIIYTNYLKSILADKNSFIREELLSIITKIMPSVSYTHLRSALEYISANYFKSDHKHIEEIINLTIIHAYGYLADNKTTVRATLDLASMLAKLKGAYTSSRSTDPDLLRLRELVEQVIKPAVKSKTEAVVASNRTGVLLYLVLRAYSMSFYSTNQPITR